MKVVFVVKSRLGNGSKNSAVFPVDNVVFPVYTTRDLERFIRK